MLLVNRRGRFTLCKWASNNKEVRSNKIKVWLNGLVKEIKNEEEISVMFIDNDISINSENNTKFYKR